MSSFASAFTWEDGIISYYKLDNSSGVVYDMLGLNDGTNNGATRGVIGKINKAFDFDGSNDYVVIPDSVTNDIVSSDEFTINFWVERDSTKSWDEMYLTLRHNMIAQIYRESSTGTIYVNVETNVGTVTIDTGDTIDTDWHMLTLTSSKSSGQVVYMDGINIGSDPTTYSSLASGTNYDNEISRKPWSTSEGFIDGLIDEIGVWDIPLTQENITELYNDGDGLPYGVEEGIVIVLESPIDGTVISDIGTNFTVIGNNLSDFSGLWQNLTYFVWDNNNTLLNSTTISISGETFNETLFIDDFGFETYLWNGEACYTNITGSYCISAVNNNTLSVSLFTIVNEYYVNDTISGTLENFSLSIDLLEGYDLTDATFMYNGTEQSPTITAESENRYLLVSDYPIPIITTDTNVSFHWELTFTGNIILNTTEKTQLIRSVLLDNCDVYTNQLFNISLYDEEEKTLLNGDIELIYTLLNPLYNTIETYNFLASGINNTRVCSGINLTGEELYYSAEIRYVAAGYTPELYHIQRSDITSDLTDIHLFDLNSTDSTEFKITYQDSGFNFVEGAIIQLQRKYISEDTYEVVEAPLTSRDGTSVVHIDLNSIKYRAVVVKNGEILDTFNNLVFKCQSELTGECEQQLLGEIDPSNDVNWDISRDFAHTISRNDTIITVSYTIPSSTPSSINIILQQKDQFDNVYTCNKTVVSSAGSIQCSITSTIGDNYVDLYINKDGVPMAFKSYIIQEDGGIDFLGNNMIIVVILMLSIVGMALTSPEWIILNAIVTIVLVGALYLINGVDFVVGLGSIMWLIIAAVILIFKLTKQEDR